MDIDNYARKIEQFAIYPEAGTGSSVELSYLALGLTGEAGEVAEKIKKLIRDDFMDEEALAKELGDVFWYLSRLCMAIEYDPSDILDINFNKLASRKRRGVLGGSGDER